MNLLQQHWTRERNPTARDKLGRANRQMGREFFKRKAEKSSREPFQAAFHGNRDL